MTDIQNNLNIGYKPWKVSGAKGKRKVTWAEISLKAAEERQKTLQAEGWENISVIAGKEAAPEEDKAA